jgi:protein SCO1/2
VRLSRNRVGAGLRLLAAGLLACLVTLYAADQPLPRELEGVGVEEKLGGAVDLDLTFIGEDGYPVALREFFNQGRPVILNLVYYNCPMLCNLVLNGQTSALREIPWTPGEEYEVVTISIDPTETFALAGKKKELYLSNYGKPAPGWHFLANHEDNARKLADQVGFGYKYDETIEQFAHAAVIMVLTADGKVSRYLYGIRFKTRDMRLALTEASDGKIGEISDRVLLFCFHYDPSEKSYVPFATNIMRAGGVLVVLILGLFLFKLWRRERIRSAEEHLVGVQ